MTGVLFDDRWHTYRDWGLELISVYIPIPDPKTQQVDIPGGDGSIDLTEVNGRPVYYDRDGVELVFYLLGNSQNWFHKLSEFAENISGKKLKFVLDEEPDHYYMARLLVDGERLNDGIGQITMSGTAEPFKYDLLSSTDECLWDSFNFETGIIQVLSDIEITNANKTIIAAGRGVDSCPVFIVTQSNNLKLEYSGRTYSLKVGRNRFPAVRVGNGDVTLVFSGTGRLSVEYRGRYL